MIRLLALLALLALFALFSSSKATFLSRKRLVRCPFSEDRVPLPSLRVVQVIRGQLHRWEQHELDGDTSCIVQIQPEYSFLGEWEAKDLFRRSSDWKLGFEPDASWEEVLYRGDPSLDLQEEIAPYGENDTTSWYNGAMGKSLMDKGVKRSDPSPGGKERIAWIGLPEDPPQGREVLGIDTRVLVEDTLEFPFRTIGYLEISWSTGQKSRCTAFLVSAYVALTNAHCLYSKERGGWITEGRFSPAQYERFDLFISRPYGSRTACDVASNQGYLYQKNSAQDYGAIFFTFPFQGQRTFMPMVFSYDPPANSEVHTAGYPGEAQGELSVEMWESSGEISSVRRRTVRHTADTSSGQSGSPLFQRVEALDEDVVIALHSYGKQKENGGTRLTSENEAIIVSWIEEGPNACSVI